MNNENSLLHQHLMPYVDIKRLNYSKKLAIRLIKAAKSMEDKEPLLAYLMLIDNELIQRGEKGVEELNNTLNYRGNITTPFGMVNGRRVSAYCNGKNGMVFDFHNKTKLVKQIEGIKAHKNNPLEAPMYLEDGTWEDLIKLIAVDKNKYNGRNYPVSTDFAYKVDTPLKVIEEVEEPKDDKEDNEQTK